MELQKGVEAMDRKEKEKLLNSPEYQHNSVFVAEGSGTVGGL